MRIALIDPSFYHQGKLLELRRIGYFALTLPRLAALIPPGHEIVLRYEKCQKIDLEARYDLVLFTTMGSNLVRAEELSAIFRRNGARTVVGGYSVEPFLDRCRQHFDAAVVGDAEGVIPRLVTDAAAGQLQPVYENRSPDLSEVPEPRFDLVADGVIGDISPVEASRGCPNCCAFCAVSNLYGSAYRQVPVPRVVRDLQAARRRWGHRLFYFTDPNFTGDMAHAKAVLHAIRPLGITWLASVDIRALEDEEFLRLAAASGCFSLQIGFETLSPEELRGMRKGFAASRDYGRLIARAQAHGIPIAALMMVGFDSDTPAVFGRLQRFLETNHLPLAVLHPVIPIPGTPLHAQLAREGRLREMSPGDVDGLHIHYQPKHFTPEALMKGFWNLNDRLYRLRSIVRRFLFPGFLRNPAAYLVLLFTNLFLARKVVSRRLPMGLYE